jgi:hypothetical protein
LGEIDKNELKDILLSIREKKKYYKLKKGGFIPLYSNGLSNIASLIDYLGIKDSDLIKESILLKKFNAMYIEESLKQNEMIYIEKNEKFQALIDSMQDINESEFKVPEHLEGVLRNYQKTGFKWFKTLSSYGFGGILADEIPRLISVDKKYATLDPTITLSGEKDISLEDLCKRFRLFCASQLGLYYTIDTMRALFASMGTSKIIILEGISGTGKTSLPYALGRFFQNPATICSVQPSWRDRSELLGFYNEFTKKFSETDFLRAVYEATYRQDPNIIVLDEMNLARIEYYFAEFLSIMEMPNVSEWNIDLIAAPQPDDPKHIKDGKLLIPQNIWFVGTANNDDSTFTITDKVYDRAMSIFFDNKGIPFDYEFTESISMPYEYLEKLFLQAKTNYPISSSVLAKFSDLDSFVISKFHLAFGNRIVKQMKDFVPCYVACGGTELQAVDYIFCNKILKKFETLNIAFLRDELNELDAKLTKLFGKNEFKMSRNKIQLLIKMNG